MRKVKLLKAVGGAEDCKPGTVKEVSDMRAARWIERGVAEPAPDETQEEAPSKNGKPKGR